MNKLNVTKIYDQPAWAYWWIAQEMSRYSIHSIKPQKFNQVNYLDMDVCLISSPNISLKIASDTIPLQCKGRRIKTIGQYSAEVDQVYANCVDLIVAISPQLYYYAKKQYKDIPVIFLPESIDTEYFTPSLRPSERFNIGTAGGPNKTVKRHHLLDYLIYPVNKMCEHGMQYFREDATLDKMREFYKSIDCFVLPSSTECCPRVVMEAMASGLPVISTNVGAVPMLLPDDSAIVSVFPESKVIYEMNKLLEYLSDKPELRASIGYDNREAVEKNFSWKNNMPIWDEVFSLLKDNNISQIIKISDDLINKYPKVFIEENYSEQIKNFAKPPEPIQHIMKVSNVKRNGK